jgi:hypothetical protein
MAGEDHSKLFKRAAEIASNVPESMQDAAFRRALDLLLKDEGGEGPHRVTANGGKNTVARQKRVSPTKDSRPQASDDRAAALIAVLDRTAYPQVTDASRLQDKALWLLRIANDEFSIDGLSAPEISKVLKEKFRLTYSRQGVGQALDGANRFVDRDTSGPVVRYRIMAPGETYLDNPADGADKSPRRKRPRSKKARGAKSAQNKASKKPAKSSGRPTPFMLLEGLVESGFFETPQAIGSIRNHLKEKQGRMYKASELSPALLRLLRNEKLTRAKNDDEQYEYSSN